MSRETFRLVLLVSCAHALVHVFELSLPSVEQMIGETFDVGKAVTGALGTAWRIPFGVGAVFAGWLADRYGSKPLLLVYLLGCAATAVCVWASSALDEVFVSMFAMGCFASIYHPAGLAIISRETTIENRARALGWHGIIGSFGIASAPFLAAMVFRSGSVTWQQYYLFLTVPAIVMAAAIALFLHEHRRTQRSESTIKQGAQENHSGETRQWWAFGVLVAAGTMQGCIYAPFMHFLPRYLGEAGLAPSGISAAGYRNELAAWVLLCGVVGQAASGRLARPDRMRSQLTVVFFANIPFLVWMAVAQGDGRLWASCLLALVHFASQPIYNSLIAEYVPQSRRSLGYGINSMITFGVGGLAPTFAGLTPQSDWTLWTYGGMAILASLAALLTLVLPGAADRDVFLDEDARRDEIRS